MDILLDKILIFVTCTILLVININNDSAIQTILIAVILTSIFMIADNERYKIFMCIGTCLVLIISKNSLYFIPVFFYDFLKIKKKIVILLLVICTILNIRDYPFEIIAMITILSIVAIWMQMQSEKKSSLEDKLIQTRDNSTELTIALKRKNKALIEKQEYEVYAATLSERNRIAREIHDNVGHMLSRSILQVGALLAIFKEENVQEGLAGIKETLDEAMNSIRKSVHDLHDASIDLEEGIKEAIAGMKGYSISLSYAVEADVEDKIKHCILTTIRESLSNVHKHSDGKEVVIHVSEHPAFYQCIVKDNGTKKPKDINGIVNMPGIGLENIRSRVESLGGNILTTNEDGYRLFIMIPKEEIKRG